MDLKHLDIGELLEIVPQEIQPLLNIGGKMQHKPITIKEMFGGDPRASTDILKRVRGYETYTAKYDVNTILIVDIVEGKVLSDTGVQIICFAKIRLFEVGITASTPLQPITVAFISISFKC